MSKSVPAESLPVRTTLTMQVCTTKLKRYPNRCSINNSPIRVSSSPKLKPFRLESYFSSKESFNCTCKLARLERYLIRRSRRKESFNCIRKLARLKRYLAGERRRCWSTNPVRPERNLTAERRGCFRRSNRVRAEGSHKESRQKILAVKHLSLIHISSPRDRQKSRMPSSA